MIHDVCDYALWRYQFDSVSRSDVLERPKESIAVAGDSDVSVFAGAVRTHNVAHPAVEGQVIGTVKHRCLKMNLGDAQHGQGRIDVSCQALFIASDPLLRPEADIQFELGYRRKMIGALN